MKRFFKRIGKGIKRIGKRIGKFMGRINEKWKDTGFLGQLAMSYIFPWAAKSIWKGASNAAGMPELDYSTEALGKVGETLREDPSPWRKTLGGSMQALHWLIKAPERAWQFITDKINFGLNNVEGQTDEDLAENLSILESGVGIGSDITESIDPSSLLERGPAQIREAEGEITKADRATAEALVAPFTASNQAQPTGKPRTPIVSKDQWINAALQVLNLFDKGEEEVGMLGRGRVMTNMNDIMNSNVTNASLVHNAATNRGYPIGDSPIIEDEYSEWI